MEYKIMWSKCMFSFFVMFIFISFFGCNSFKYANMEKQNRILERSRVNFNELDVIYTEEEEKELINFFYNNELDKIYKEIERTKNEKTG